MSGGLEAADDADAEAEERERAKAREKVRVPARVTLVVETTVDVVVEAMHGTPFEAIVGEAKRQAFEKVKGLVQYYDCPHCNHELEPDSDVAAFKLKDVPAVKLDG